MEDLAKYLPLLIPIIVIELILMISSLVHALTHKNYKFGSRGLWVFLSIFVQVIGPILYFAVGRSEED